MNNATKHVALFVAIAVVVIGAITLFLSSRWLISLFGELDRQVAIVTGVTAATILAAAFIVRRKNSSTLAYAGTNVIRSRKMDLYEHLLRAVIQQVELEKLTSTIGDLEGELTALQRKLILFGSPNVIKLASQILNHSEQGVPTDDCQLSLLRKLILAMRKDLGQSNVGLQSIDLRALLHGRSSSTADKMDF